MLYPAVNETIQKPDGHHKYILLKISVKYKDYDMSVSLAYPELVKTLTAPVLACVFWFVVGLGPTPVNQFVAAQIPYSLLKEILNLSCTYENREKVIYFKLFVARKQYL